MIGLAYALLGMLARKPCSGYELMKLLKLFWQAQHSQIYPLLAKLEKEGLVDVRADRPDRQAGQEALQHHGFGDRGPPEMDPGAAADRQHGARRVPHQDLRDRPRRSGRGPQAVPGAARSARRPAAPLGGKHQADGRGTGHSRDRHRLQAVRPLLAPSAEGAHGPGGDRLARLVLAVVQTLVRADAGASVSASAGGVGRPVSAWPPLPSQPDAPKVSLRPKK